MYILRKQQNSRISLKPMYKVSITEKMKYYAHQTNKVRVIYFDVNNLISFIIYAKTFNL